MSNTASLSTLAPAIVIHIVFAAGALALGPLALAARAGTRLHRGVGYAWVTLMIGAALSSLFIRDFRLPNVAGYTPIHILTAVSLGGVAVALLHIARGRIRAHRRAMWLTYGGAVLAGLFALLPGRYFGDLVWRDGVRAVSAPQAVSDRAYMSQVPNASVNPRSNDMPTFFATAADAPLPGMIRQIRRRSRSASRA
jgi:uncharacterized membrane protein